MILSQNFPPSEKITTHKFTLEHKFFIFYKTPKPWNLLTRSNTNRSASHSNQFSCKYFSCIKHRPQPHHETRYFCGKRKPPIERKIYLSLSPFFYWLFSLFPSCKCLQSETEIYSHSIPITFVKYLAVKPQGKFF